MTTTRKIRIALWALALVAGLTVLWMRVIEPRLSAGAADTLGRGDYALSATDGTTFTQRTLKGTPSAVFFGFTHCPEVCPTTLGDVAQWQEALAKNGKQLRVYFVTVDPERDTAQVLGDYVSWVPGVVGVTGSREEIDKAILAIRIIAQRVPLAGGGYTMDHSASVLLFDDKGKLFEPIGYQEGYDRAIAKLNRLFELH
jgi:protein SCO1/2